jgi:hypothetical protein
MAFFELLQYVPMCVSRCDIYSHSRLLFPQKVTAQHCAQIHRHNIALKHLPQRLINDSICPTDHNPLQTQTSSHMKAELPLRIFSKR